MKLQPLFPSSHVFNNIMSTDPYTQTASEKSTLSPQEKINALSVLSSFSPLFTRIGSFEFILISFLLIFQRHKIIKASKTSMMTTRGPSGFLTSRAMAPASCSSSSLLIPSVFVRVTPITQDNVPIGIIDESLHFNYLANNTSGKFVCFPPSALIPFPRKSPVIISIIVLN